VITFQRLKYLSFTHSVIYLTLLVSWAAGAQRLQYVFGWGHGIGWICVSLLCLEAVRRRVIPLWLAVLVVVVGGVGPFAGSIGFIVCERRGRRPATSLRRGMV
jgi:hypothetical protein